MQPPTHVGHKGNIEMSKIDYNRVGLLTHILDGTRQLPKLAAIHNAAMAELQAIADELARPENAPGLKAVTPPDGPANSAVAPRDPKPSRGPGAEYERLPTERVGTNRDNLNQPVGPNPVPLGEVPNDPAKADAGPYVERKV